ncbi:dipeptide ABC transporter ATP-binding protein [Rhodococcus wratislaviensis]|uniref:Putative ABC transporter ATP-binding protein n=1 Tax=Rhodococcus wratislaviensis NBRC 100605 TaxID=1219028 RepID=X0PYZ7_RHOWR|nr:ABC transporter ATP-binding protein [Rhodococcus wratislaviensis]GAF43677.1 putative ABC transporter ATP-binding protein [Rhodococcus wratislaviensis NBRC 100605]
MNSTTTLHSDQRLGADEAPTELLAVQNLRVAGASGKTLVADASFSLKEGEAIAIVGESGSGKSLTARSIIGLLPSGLTASGSIRYRGREVLSCSTAERTALRGSEICMILQDPFTMLHPMITCGDVITENLRKSNGRRLPRATRKQEAVTRLAEVGIRDPRVADRYPFELSGGMRQRVAIAAALAQNPRLLIADEPSTALDATTQQEVLDLLVKLQRSRGMALILITHDLRVAFSVCQQVNVFYAGEVAESGPATAIATNPQHPYTMGLLLAEPPVDRRIQDFFSIPGSVPTPDAVSDRCSFAARCDWKEDICLSGKPILTVTAPGRQVACARTNDIRSEMQRVQSTFANSELPILEFQGKKTVLETRNLEVTFGDPKKKSAVRAVGGVSITIYEGESVGIVGESGSGKTTFSRTIVGLAKPTAGSINLGGIDSTSYDALSPQTRREARRRVQIVFQDPYSSLNPVHSIGAALTDALRFRLGSDAKATDVEALLERVGLPASYKNRMPNALSGGERQRIAIARALAVQPRLLILDEPVSALDVSVQAQILTLLREIREELGLAYLFITHDLAVVRQVADRIYVMNRGQVVEEGPTTSILDAPQHEYTRLLVGSIPDEHGRAQKDNGA